jgi:hypothetical protein
MLEKDERWKSPGILMRVEWVRHYVCAVWLAVHALSKLAGRTRVPGQSITSFLSDRAHREA